jgi:hypothetical protein
MLNVIMLNVIMLNVVMLNVVMLNVVAPFHSDPFVYFCKAQTKSVCNEKLLAAITSTNKI